MHSISSDTWVVHSMTNADIEYSVRRNNSEDNLNITSYICSCHDFRARQLPYKHIFAVLSRLQVPEESEETDQLLQFQQSEMKNFDSSNPSYPHVNYKEKEKYEFEKLQEELQATTAEWKDKNYEDIHSLRSTGHPIGESNVTPQQVRIARIDAVPETIDNDDDEAETSNATSKNVKFKKQSRF
ncbi:hypothetical protein C2G38_2226004 [Gigaspora rosea]|uniref:SWIM-type domain-containing protein n=1 Tax=Gigaspora rosea TaxID=44941 RepID=A0A397U2V8_9GLOM|nr:hypothetical protein C2G38_2226004 [Gigaspora rosea]